MTEHAVVVAGGGPTGLMLAGELTLAGVDVVVVERRADAGARRLARRRSSRPHDRGARPARHRRTVRVGRAATSERRLRRDPVGHHRLPDAPQLPARAVATRLRAHPRPAGSTSSERPILRGHEVVGFAQDDAGVDVELSDGTTLRAAYLVGCDGGRSAVRKAAGIDFVGVDADDQLHDRRGRDDGGAGDRRAPRGRRHRSGGPGGRWQSRTGSCCGSARSNPPATILANPRCRTCATRSSPPTGPTSARTTRPGSPGSPT